MVDAEVEFFAPVIHGDCPPPVARGGCAEGMGELGLGDVENLSVI